MKAKILAFETIDNMEKYLGNASSDYARQTIINYRQDVSASNWSKFLLKNE